jgi:hypothetical protein
MDVDFRAKLSLVVRVARLAGHLTLQLQLQRVVSIKSSEKTLTELSDTLRVLR